MRGALPRRSGYAVVPQLELGVGRLAIALRGEQRLWSGDLRPIRRDRFYEGGSVENVIALPRTRSRRPGRRDDCIRGAAAWTRRRSQWRSGATAASRRDSPPVCGGNDRQ